MAQSTDRNLLLGILALQNDLVTRDQLIDAMNVWVVAKNRPLGEVLVERGALDQERCRLLEQLLDAHVQRHGSVERSLAACELTSSVRSALGHVVDAGVQATLSVLQQPGEPDVTEAPSSATTAGSGSRGGTPEAIRYRVLRSHAKGGLGEVFVAEDLELHREVALKEIQRQHSDQDASRGRFVLEAEITGSLEHPGIVPVYGLGTYADGRPFYAMRFIKGDNLKHACDRFHQSGARFDSLDFRQLLGRFIDVCNAVAYAHSRGVLHRDLKPGNIMLGKFGETLVVDWGLAKVVGRADSSGEEPTLIPASGSGIAETMQGAAIGTPAFMSPEQALGKVAELGPATDVYSLGATLYALLTNRPPMEGDNLAMVLHKVQSGSIPRPRDVNGTIPAALEAVCLKAMALQPGNRYTTALALAGDLEHWLADEPVGCYREPLSVRAGRWVKQHRTLVTSGAVAVLLLLAGVTAGLVLVTQHSRELAAANQREREAREQAEVAEKRAVDEAAVAKAVNEFLQNDLLGLAGAEEQLGALIKPDPDLKLWTLLDRALAKVDERFANQPEVRAAVQATLAKSFLSIGRYDDAVRLCEQVREYREQVLGREHLETLDARSGLAYAYRMAGDFDEALPLMEDTLRLQKVKLGRDDPQTLISMGNLADAYGADGQLDQALALSQETLELSRAKLGPNHPDTLGCMSNLACVYEQKGQHDEALSLHEQTLELKQRTLGSEHPATLTTMNNLAVAYKYCGQLDKALPLFVETLRLRTKTLGANHPYTISSMGNLADAYSAARQFDKALPLAEETLEHYKAQLGPDHLETVTFMANLGSAYAAAGQPDRAVPILKDSLQRLTAKLGPDHPDMLSAKANLAMAYQRMGDLESAIPLHEESLQQLKATLGSDHAGTLAVMNNLANAYLAVGQCDKALSLYEEFISRYRQLPPDDVRLANNLATFSAGLLKHQQFAPAERFLRECLAIREKVQPNEWTMFNTKSMLGSTLLGQATQLLPSDAAAANAKFAEAEPLLLHGYEGMEQHADQIAAKGRSRLIDALQSLIDLYSGWGKSDEAAKWQQKQDEIRTTVEAAGKKE